MYSKWQMYFMGNKLITNITVCNTLYCWVLDQQFFQKIIENEENGSYSYSLKFH